MAWTALLAEHVRWLPDNKQSRVDYKGIAARRAALQKVLAEWSAVTPAAFGAFSRPQQMAFFINAYASIGCPALRPEAFTAAKLEAQLDDSMLRFMADRTRNRYAESKLQVSLIFKWFREDFEKGHKGFNTLEDFMARYADQLADSATDRDRIKAKNAPITHLDYDWTFNRMGR